MKSLRSRDIECDFFLSTDFCHSSFSITTLPYLYKIGLSVLVSVDRKTVRRRVQYRRDSCKVSAKRYGCQRQFDVGQVFPVLTSLVNWQRFFSLSDESVSETSDRRILLDRLLKKLRKASVRENRKMK